MEGGMNAWNGLRAAGPPDAGMAYFSDWEKPEDIIALAWLLEEGARLYYRGIEEMMSDKSQKDLFRELGAAEVRHKAVLVRLHRELRDSGSAGLPEKEMSGVMESGMHITEALDWASGKDIRDILEFSMAMETNSLDLYIKMERDMKDAGSKKVFRSLVDEEKQHLERLVSLLDVRPR